MYTANLDGEARFTLDCYHLGPHDRVMTTEVIVQTSVECGWDAGWGRKCAEIVKVEILYVSLIVGGVTVAEDLTMDQLHGSLEHFVRLQCADMGIEGFGIKEDDVKQAIEDVADDEQFQREHAAGRV